MDIALGLFLFVALVIALGIACAVVYMAFFSLWAIFHKPKPRITVPPLND